MQRFTGLVGIIIILLIALLMSDNRKKISIKTVGVGWFLQVALAVFVLKIPIGQVIFEKIGLFIEKLLIFATQGADFVFGFLSSNPDRLNELFGEGSSFIFAIKLIPTIILVMALVNILYHLGIMQKIVEFFAKIMYKIMNVSGAEALSNIASAFVGQVEAQIMIKPYIKNMTMSELLASMSGSMACIAGSIMAVYISMGIPAKYLLAASVMAAPGALVISKIVMPETEESETKGEVKLEVKKTNVNLIDAIAQGAYDGLKIGISIIAMIIALIALINLCDWILAHIGHLFVDLTKIDSFLTIDLNNLSLKEILGKIFSIFALSMGVPADEMTTVGSLMGEKLVFNEFIAYVDLTAIKDVLSEKSFIIASFALCGFANFSSIAMQIGGIGNLAPNRRTDLAKLGIKALICGTLASYLSAAIAGILM